MLASESLRIFDWLPSAFESEPKVSGGKLPAFVECFDPPEESAALIEQEQSFHFAAKFRNRPTL